MEHRVAEEPEESVSSRSCGSRPSSRRRVGPLLSRGTLPHRSQTTRQSRRWHAAGAHSSGSASLDGERRRRTIAQAVARTPCSFCGDRGHWRDRCPLRGRGASHSQAGWDEYSEHEWYSSGTGARRRYQVGPRHENLSYRARSEQFRLRPGEVLVDTCCPRACAGQDWHIGTRQLLSYWNRRGNLVIGPERFEFGMGDAVISNRRWSYPVRVADTWTTLDF